MKLRILSDHELEQLYNIHMVKDFPDAERKPLTAIRRLVEIAVPAEYPRTRAALARPEMVSLKEELIELLRKQVTP